MKESNISIKLSKELHDAIYAEAMKNKMSMAAYIRAVMAHQVFGKKTVKFIGEEWMVAD